MLTTVFAARSEEPGQDDITAVEISWSARERDFLKFHGIFELKAGLQNRLARSGESLEALSGRTDGVRASIWINLSFTPTKVGIYVDRTIPSDQSQSQELVHQQTRLPESTPDIKLVIAIRMGRKCYPICTVQAEGTLLKQLGLFFGRDVDLRSLGVDELTADPTLPPNWSGELSWNLEQ